MLRFSTFNVYMKCLGSWCDGEILLFYRTKKLGKIWKVIQKVVTHVKSEAIHWALTLKIILNSGCIQYIKKKTFVPPQTKATQAWTDQIICHSYLKTYAGTCKNIHQLNIIFRCHVLTNLFQSVIENYDFCRDCIVARNRTLQEKFAIKMSQDFCGFNLQHIFFCCISSLAYFETEEMTMITIEV